MNSKALQILTTWPFLISLTMLLANDWWLKALFPNMLTGKLSDFTGVAVVALLLFNAIPHRKWLIWLVISGAFLWWKSPLSDPLIHFVNSLSAIRIGRIVDYSDLWALTVLPACLYIAVEQARFRVSLSHFRRIITVPLATVTLFAIVGTSSLPIRQEYVVQPISSSVKVSRENLVSAIAEVAAKHGLTCKICPDESDSARYVYVGKGLSMSYTLRPNNAVSFVVHVNTNRLFVFGASDKEMADSLRASLRKLLAKRFDNLEFIEPFPYD